MVLGLIAFISIIASGFSLYQIFRQELPRASTLGNIVNLSLLIIFLFFISFILLFNFNKGFGEIKRNTKISNPKFIGLVALIFVILDFAALSDIGQAVEKGKYIFSFELGILIFSAILFISFFIFLYLSTKKLLAVSKS